MVSKCPNCKKKITGFDKLLCLVKKHYPSFLEKYENIPEPISVDNLCDIASTIISYHLGYS